MGFSATARRESSKGFAGCQLGSKEINGDMEEILDLRIRALEPEPPSFWRREGFEAFQITTGSLVPQEHNIHI